MESGMAGLRDLPPVVELRGVAKRYGGAEALRNLDLAVRAGEVHCLVGENGAGKSTLGKIVAGVIRPDDGSLRVDGEEVSFRAGPRDALAHGIAIVEQELSLVPAMTAIENVLLGALQRQGRRKDRDRVAAVNEELGLEVRL